ncbi:flagellar motor switch protein FliN [Romboutsia weinsteinii]|uniref:Flagellar motor switch protein FliN n=1 Tax=Romboutsia weinsteinii TaxID=2020949 RepID=A0A371J851_9FIRM|nr:flagellar motor switch protein FliN [Romboutsia weinsteinii]RDY28942.1 flagellar motor switch protein FliN [Romboutsia weinsteinii]
MTEKISRILDIPLEITALLGKTKMNLKDIIELGKGSIIELDTLADQEVEILVNGKKIAYGQVVIVEQNFGVRITSILDEEELVKTIA